MAQHSKWVGRLTVVVFGVLLAGVIVCNYNVSASSSGTGIFNDQGVEIVLESQVNDSILWHVPLPDVEHSFIFASMVHDELGNSYVLTNNSIVSIDLEGRQRWTAIIPKQGKVPRGLIRGEDGTIYLLESAEFLDNRYTKNTGWITAVSPFTGKILWENGLPNGERMSPNIVAAGNKNGIFVVSAETGAHIAYDRNGNILWVNSMNEAWSLAVDPTGGFVAAGYNETYGTYPYIVHWSEDGKLDWRSDPDHIPINGMSIRVGKNGEIYAKESCSILRWDPERESFGLMDNPDHELLEQFAISYDPNGGRYCYNGWGLFKTSGPGTSLQRFNQDPVYTYNIYMDADWNGNLAFTDEGGSWHRLDSEGNRLSELIVRNAEVTYTPVWTLANGTSITSSSTFGIIAIGDAGRPVTVFVNGNPVLADAKPRLVNDQTFVPLRAVAEALGAGVEWNGTEQSIKITLNGKTVTLWINQLQALVDTDMLLLDTAPFLSDDHTLVPLRFLSAALGCEVSWDQVNRFASVASP